MSLTTRSIRRLVLFCAFAAGVAAWVASTPPRLAQAAEPGSTSAQTETKPTSEARAAPADAANKGDRALPDKADGEPDVTITPRVITIDRGHKHVRIGTGVDREYDSFEQFAKDAPWLAGLVFFVVALVFLVPLLIIVLLIWYKVRKNRMLNETMIKLAEKGVVPPAEAIDALSANRVGAAVTSSPATAPMYGKTKPCRKSANRPAITRGRRCASWTWSARWHC